jgi:hypothetical protein
MRSCIAWFKVTSAAPEGWIRSYRRRVIDVHCSVDGQVPSSGREGLPSILWTGLALSNPVRVTAPGMNAPEADPVITTGG